MTIFPGIHKAFLDIVDPHNAGDPGEDGVLWTNLSRPQIAEELGRRGFRVSVAIVSQLLARHRLGRRKAIQTQSTDDKSDQPKTDTLSWSLEQL